ncbi:hypothetical protein MM239_10980 [Belliella sp. DSM 111904]|uniref:Uncharacterized protein n=1 Tax=Belliella filtrata TaxID=2923435 RepID=A0ABS9V0J0_9BACT|nr:hypothetical protein [Belliella filtrata]MCH7409919.1 hypothetical protein [Belliella filtrata]
MDNRFSKFKNWISSSFQLITIVLLVFSIIMILNQRQDINELKNQINSMGNTDDLSLNFYDIESKLDDIESKLYDVENNLIREIEDVKTTIMIWSD